MVNNNTHNTKTVDQSAVVQKVLDPQIQILYIKLIGSEKIGDPDLAKPKKYIFSLVHISNTGTLQNPLRIMKFIA